MDAGGWRLNPLNKHPLLCLTQNHPCRVFLSQIQRALAIIPVFHLNSIKNASWCCLYDKKRKKELIVSILVTASRVFVKLPDGFSPLERMVLQTTGNLQRLLSAYFNVPSRVTIIKNELVPCEAGSSGSDDDDDTCRHSSASDLKSNLDMRFERRILMHFGDKFAYDADSIVTVNDQKTLGLLTNHEFGLGQVFRYVLCTRLF